MIEEVRSQLATWRAKLIETQLMSALGARGLTIADLHGRVSYRTELDDGDETTSSYFIDCAIALTIKTKLVFDGTSVHMEAVVKQVPP